MALRESLRLDTTPARIFALFGLGETGFGWGDAEREMLINGRPISTMFVQSLLMGRWGGEKGVLSNVCNF